MNRAIILYQMDYANWHAGYFDEIVKGRQSYRTWYLQNAERIEIPDDVYSNTIEIHPVIMNYIANSALAKHLHIFDPSPTDNLIYFVFKTGVWLNNFESELFKKFKTPELDFFVPILKDVVKQRKFVVVEYNKKIGLFDNDKVIRQFEQRNSFPVAITAEPSRQ